MLVVYNSITAGSVTGDCESEERQRSVAPDCQDPAIRHGGTLHTQLMCHTVTFSTYIIADFWSKSNVGPNHSLSGLTLNVFGERGGGSDLTPKNIYV